jgi:anti-sigma B factor antagonist
MEQVTHGKSELELTTENGDRRAVVAASGILDMATIGDLESVVDEALSGAQDVVVDLSQVAMCDSAGLGGIVRMHRQAIAAGREFRLRNPHKHVNDLLAMTGINKVVSVDPA